MAKARVDPGATMMDRGTNFKGREREDMKSIGEKELSAIKRRLARGKILNLREIIAKHQYGYFNASNIRRMPDDREVHEA
jgi:hypothetical protein